MLVKIISNCDYGKPGEIVDVDPNAARLLIAAGRAEALFQNRDAAKQEGILKRG